MAAGSNYGWPTSVAAWMPSFRASEIAAASGHTAHEEGLTTSTKPMHLRIRGVRGAFLGPIPKAIRKSISKFKIGFSVSLFSRNDSFFGNTWCGRLRTVKIAIDSDSATHTIPEMDFDDVVYYHSAIDERADHVGVLELVAEALDDTGKTLYRFGAGWATLPLYGGETTKDNHIIHEEQSVHLWPGTPRYLLTIDSKSADLLNPIGSKGRTSAVVRVVVAPCPQFKQFASLVAADTVVGRPDRIPGLWNVDEASNRCPSDLSRASLAPAVTFALDFVSVEISPTVARLDAEVADAAKHEWGRLNMSDSELNNEAVSASIVERRLRYGIHNGRRFIRPTAVVHLVFDADNPKRLTFPGAPALESCPIDPSVAAVFELEYVVELMPTISDSQPHMSTGAMSRSLMQTLLGSPIKNRAVRTLRNKGATYKSVTVSWQPVVLFERGARVPLSVEYSMPMQGGVHCHPLSKPVFTGVDRVSGNDPNGALYPKVILEVGLSRTSDVATAARSSMHVPGFDTAWVESKTTNLQAMKSSVDIQSAIKPDDDDEEELQPREGGGNLHAVAWVSTASLGRSRLATTKATPSRAAEAALTHVHFDTKLSNMDEKHISEASRSKELLDDEVERNDQRRASRVELQLRAFSYTPLSSPDVPAVVNNIVITYKLFDKRRFRSPPLSLVQLDGDLSAGKDPLRLLQEHGNPKFGVADLYNFDASTLQSDDVLQPFVKYFAAAELQIDVWDSASWTLLGTAELPLRCLLRGGQACVSKMVSINVKRPRSFWNRGPPTGGDPSATLTMLRHPPEAAVSIGSLHMRICNFGRVATAKLPADPLALCHVIRTGITSTDLAAHATSALTVRRPLGDNIQQKPRLSHVLEAAPSPEGGMSPLEKRLARLALIKQRKSSGADPALSLSALSGPLSMNMPKARLLSSGAGGRTTETSEAIKVLRAEQKHARIANALARQVTTSRIIRPSFGTPFYFEFVLKNPRPTKAVVRIHINDTEIASLRVVINHEEQQRYKHHYGIAGAVEPNMFHAVCDASDTSIKSVEVMLSPSDEVNVPFICEIGNIPFRENLSPLSSSAGDGSTDLSVEFSIQQNTVSVLNLKVEPQPFVVDRLLHFWHQPKSMLLRTVRVPPNRVCGAQPAVLLQTSASDQAVLVAPTTSQGLKIGSKLTAYASTAAVVCAVSPVKGTAEQDITLKAAVGSLGDLGRGTNFYVALFTDSFALSPSQIWQIAVHPATRVELAVTQGQLTQGTIVVHGSNLTRLVRLHAPANELNIPDDRWNHAAILESNTMEEVPINVLTLEAGRKEMFITLTDDETCELLCTYVIMITATPPSVSREYEIVLAPGKQASKRITYTNQYSVSRTFRLLCSHPDLLSFASDEVVCPPSGRTFLRLRFSPTEMGQLHKHLIFVTNGDGGVEDCFAIITKTH